MLTVGVVTVELTTMFAEALQPVVVLVTVTAYVPAALTVSAAVVLPEVHKYVTPDEGEAVSIAVGVIQVKSLFFAIEAAGNGVTTTVVVYIDEQEGLPR